MTASTMFLSNRSAGNGVLFRFPTGGRVPKTLPNSSLLVNTSCEVSPFRPEVFFSKWPEYAAHSIFFSSGLAGTGAARIAAVNANANMLTLPPLQPSPPTPLPPGRGEPSKLLRHFDLRRLLEPRRHRGALFDG